MLAKFKVIICIWVLILSSCKTEESKIALPDIHGKWNIYSALRNGKETKTLESGYFVFDTSAYKVSSNIFPTSEDFTFSLDDKKINIATEPKIIFTITEKSNDSMSLKGSVGPFLLELYTLRGDSLPVNIIEAPSE